MFGWTPWVDPDGTPADVGAYGGPFAVVAAGAVPRFLLPVTSDLVAYVTTNSTHHPVVLSAYDPFGGTLTYAANQPGHGTLSGAASNRLYTPAANYSGPDTFTYTATSGSRQSNSATVSILVENNHPPTLNSIADVVVGEESSTRTVYLSGITAGANESQVMTVSATSSNPGLIPNPTVYYTSPHTTGHLSFTPAANASGSATITVTVDDWQGANSTVARAFAVTATPVNDPPTLDAISNVILLEDAGAHSVPLAGITAGGGESQALTVTATSSNAGLIPDPTVSYASPNATGSLSLTPAASASGSATITVTVSDGQGSDGFATRTFTVAVSPLNDPPTLDLLADLSLEVGAGHQTVPLGGITAGAGESQALTVVAYFSPEGSGSLGFTPAPNAVGTAMITVTVNDGEASNNVASRTFVVAVGNMLMWRENVEGHLFAWVMDGPTMIGGDILSPNGEALNWEVVGRGDFDGDGKSDIPWREIASGFLYVWYMDGVNMIDGSPLSPSTATLNWKVAAVGDFNADGRPDILWRDGNEGSLYVWYMDGVVMTGGGYLSPDQVSTDWEVVGYGDGK